MYPSAVDLFAGPGGWDVAACALGLHPLGIENDDAACRTRRMAGLNTMQADIRDVEPIPAVGLIASPPCQTFSAAGKGSGRKSLDEVLIIAHRLAQGHSWRALTSDLADERTALVLEPLHWALTMRRAGTPYRWIVLEQVPPVLPVWQYYVELLRWMGYSAVTGYLSAEQYGVPQTRKRAILIASLDHKVAMPAPTHSRYYSRTPDKLDPGLSKWVSMAEALGWGMTERPYPVLASGRTSGGPDKEKVGGSEARKVIYEEQAAGRWIVAAGQNSPATARVRPRPVDGAPAPTVTGIANAVWLRQSALAKATVRHEDQPAPTITAAHDRAERVWLVNNTSRNAGRRSDDQPAPTMYFGERLNTAVWTDERPATTVAGDARIWPPGHKVNGDDRRRLGVDEANDRYGDRAGTEAVRVSVEEAAILQSFPPDYPWQGTRTKQYQQIGNAVPPLLALHVLAAAQGLELDHVEE